MNLREYLEELKAVYEQHGDIPVKTKSGWDIQDARGPEIRTMKILSGRQYKQRFWQPTDGEESKGEKVVDL